MEEKKVSKKPEDSDFKQQRLKAWQPLLTPTWVIGTFVAIGVIFLPIGFAILNASNNVVEVSKRYDNLESCASVFNTSGATGPCYVNLTIPQDMSSPVYFYYELSNFYQNHRRYVKSRSDTQLRGSLSTSESACSPIETGQDNLQLVPCGLIAVSFFNDTFAATLYGDGAPIPFGTDGTDPNWKKDGIAWKSDVEHKFKYTAFDTALYTNVTSDGKVLPRVDDEDFIVWMRTAGLPTFKKLYRIINRGFQEGEVLQIAINNVYPVYQFNGAKTIVLSTTSWLGGKNDFLGWAYIFVGSLCLVLAILFQIKHSVSPRRLGDMQYFHWSGAGNKQMENGME